MGFQQHLGELCKVEGALAASLMARDGVSVETVFASSSEVDLNLLLVEYAGVLAQARTSSEVLEAGAVDELTIGAERVSALLRVVNDEYFLVLALRSSGNVGKGRYLLRITAPKLRSEL